MYRNQKGWKKLFVVMLIALLSLTLIVACTPAEPEGDDEDSGVGNQNQNQGKGDVDIGYVNWAECVAVSNLWKVILEEEGYNVKLTQLDVAPLFVGLNKGDIDVFMDSWLPITHETYWEKYKENLEDYGIWYEESAKIGIVVPEYVNIDSIGDLKNNADKFESEIIGIDPGAGIMKAADRANEDYGLDFEVVQGSEPAMMAALDKAYDDEDWIAITGWSPHWMFAKYELKYLQDPEKSFGKEEEIHILANKNFSEEQPEVAAMLKKFKMTDKQIGSLEGLINEGMEPTDAAKQWKQDNQDVIDTWMSE